MQVIQNRAEDFPSLGGQAAAASQAASAARWSNPPTSALAGLQLGVGLRQAAPARTHTHTPPVNPSDASAFPTLGGGGAAVAKQAVAPGKWARGNASVAAAVSQPAPFISHESRPPPPTREFRTAAQDFPSLAATVCLPW